MTPAAGDWGWALITMFIEEVVPASGLGVIVTRVPALVPLAGFGSKLAVHPVGRFEAEN